MMNLDNLINAGKKVDEELIKIAKRMGARRAEEYAESIEIIGKEMERYVVNHRKQPIIEWGEFHMAYIKDNSYPGKKYDKEINKHGCFISGNKVHFYCCSTLEEMARKGCESRYRATNETDNKQVIDLGRRKGIKTRLAWCQNCINLLHFYEKKPTGSYDPVKIARSSDAKELMARVKAHHLEALRLKEFNDNKKGPTQPTGYPKNWSERSKGYREYRNYTCEICKVNCSEHPGLTDAHHINHVKEDCRYENLQCLCKYHHAQLHPHYQSVVKETDRNTLRRLWKEQNIPLHKREMLRQTPG